MFRVTIFADPNGNLRQDPGEALVIDREFVVDSVCRGARPKAPVTKDECKRDGWRNLGTAFKDEGQCVAFVERHPKP
jgi:hypothetical protein